MVSQLFMVGIDADELHQSIVSGVVEALGPVLARTNEPRLVNRERMAELAGISVPTLDRLVSEGSVPSKRIGNRRLFQPAKVIDALPDAKE